MKKLILLSIISFMVLLANAQNLFTDSTANWTVLYAAYCDPSCNPSFTLYDYSIKGDTTINNNTYQKIFLDQFEYYGAIRDENSKVYIIPADDSSEEILYDFDLNLGDMYYSAFFDMSFQVVDIDSIPDIYGQQHKIIYFDDYLNDYIGVFWIEGIGSSGGLLKPIQTNEIFLCGCGNTEDRDIICFHRNDSLIYMSNGFPDCYPLDDVNIIKNPKAELNVYPNPTTGKISIQSKSSVRVIVYDLHGKEIYKGNNKELDLSTTPKGIYFIKVITDKKILAKRLIIK